MIKTSANNTRNLMIIASPCSLPPSHLDSTHMAVARPLTGLGVLCYHLNWYRLNGLGVLCYHLNPFSHLMTINSASLSFLLSLYQFISILSIIIISICVDFQFVLTIV